MSHESLIIGKRYLRLRQVASAAAPDQFETRPMSSVRRWKSDVEKPFNNEGLFCLSHLDVTSCSRVAKRFDGDHISLFCRWFSVR